MEKREVSFEEMRKIELDILCEIDEICAKLNLRYSLCGGTLLGAVRHNGFIPWDDDIDVFMPRPDYDKFIEYCKDNNTMFRLISTQTEKNYGYLFAKAVNRQTEVVENYIDARAFDLGVYVDVFPIEGLANSYDEAIKKFNKTSFKRELLVARNWNKFFKSKTKAWYFEPIRFAFFILSRFFSKKKLVKSIEKVYSQIDFDNVQFAGTVCGSYRTKEIMDRTIYAEYIYLPFEDKKFMALKNYDKYLTDIYGDYMQLPSKEKQVTHHSFKAYWKD